MAQLLGQVSVGSTVYVKNSGGAKLPFYVGVHNYESGLNGQGRTLLVSQGAAGTMQWNNSNFNAYATSTIDNWLNTNYLNFFGEKTQGKIGQTKFYYTVGGGSENVTSLSRAIFLLSVKELGITYQFANSEGSALPIATTINMRSQWTRSATKTTNLQANLVKNRQAYNTPCTQAENIYPAFTLPGSLYVLDDGTVSVAPPAPALTVPANAMQGQSISITWTASANADSYQLQRNTGSGWTTIYTGPNLTYTDTAGSWSTVQYQVAAGLNGEYGEYATSAAIPVISASALVISGSDEDLGTITADIPYTVTSDTGNQITHTLTVNGVQFATATEASGVAHSIPVMELPTGTGTIIITASVQATSGPVTATRTWTYTKAPISFPDAAGVGVLQKNGQNFLPATLAELVRTNPFWGGNLGTALEMLSGLMTSNFAQIEVGSYMGTGVSGSGNPNRLTLEGDPQLVIVQQKSPNGYIAHTFIAIKGNTKAAILHREESIFVTISWTNNGLLWYGDSPTFQLNLAGNEYSYFSVIRKE